MSDEEYQRLCTVCVSVGARSISDLARTAVTRLIGPAGDLAGDPVVEQMRSLDRTVQQLKSRVELLSKRLAAAERPGVPVGDGPAARGF